MKRNSVMKKFGFSAVVNSRQYIYLSILYGVVAILILPGRAFGQTAVLQAGDGVRLTVYNVPGVSSGDYFIQENGRLQLPYIGQIPAANRPFSEIEQSVLAKYQRIYNAPELSLHPLIRIQVLGEVQNPGIFYITGVDKLSDVLALAGGVTNAANIKKVHIIHEGEAQAVNLKEVLEKGQRVDDFGLSPGDQIYLPKRRWVNFRSASVMISAAALLLSALEVMKRN